MKHSSDSSIKQTISIRFDIQLLDKLKTYARHNKVSLNKAVNKIIVEALFKLEVLEISESDVKELITLLKSKNKLIIKSELVKILISCTTENPNLSIPEILPVFAKKIITKYEIKLN